MSSNDPTIIRSNAPFKVEVTAGSLNAGGKKNGIVAGDASGQKRDKAFDFDNAATPDALAHGVDGEHAPDAFHTEASDPQAKLNANVKEPEARDNLLQLDEAFASLDHQVSVLLDAAQDAHVKLPQEPAMASDAIKIDHDALGSNEIKLPKDTPSAGQRIALPGEKTVDDVVKLESEGANPSDPAKILVKQDSTSSVLIDAKKAQDNVARLEKDKASANNQVLPADAAAPDNRQPLGLDDSTQSRTGVEGAAGSSNQSLWSHDTQSFGREGIDSDGAKVNVQKLPGQGDEDNHQRLSEDLQADNVQHLPASTSDHAGTPSVLAKHAPLTEQVLAALAEKGQIGPGPQSVQAAHPAPISEADVAAPVALQPSQAVPVVSAKRAQLLEVRNALMSEKQKKDEEFSGRVNAIRKSVAHVNAQLDQVESTPRVEVE